ncbi:GDSL-type esterase/lipase family protein [Halobacillus litoralis]|uniref:SGNH hydrolase-type esterase domain-containing protein n=1 Tax=Halobacillus litoralis TaxID=45668 RepID=A0A410MI55_9BACI|nr:GDSL-type esterase/lipase family protein [Halobacillus litoralis]QAS54378.1 hypothetical protein HLI_20240 [Halobacillus litoralis]
MRKQKKWSIAAIIIITIAIGLFSFQSTMFSQKEERIVALGDSLTFGVGDQSGNGYVENLDQWLDEHHERKVTVDNYAIPDQQTDGMLGQMNEAAVLKSIEKADYILLFIGTNDVIKSNGGDLTEIRKDQIAKGEKDYEKNLKKIMDTVREENPDAPILFLGLYSPYPDHEKINTIINNWNENSRKLIDGYDNVHYIKTKDLFEEKSRKHFSDALHLNEQGYERLTKRILDEYDF